MVVGKHLSPMGFTPENPLVSHMNNFSWESRLGAPLVGTGEGREADRRGEAGVVELGGNGIQASDQVPQASAAGQLGEGHSAELLGAVQVAHTAVAAVAGDDAGKRPPRDELHELREDGLATIHVQTL